MPRRIALFGQAAFARDVLVRLCDAGHALVGVYAPPEGGRPDPLAEEAARRALPLFRHARFRRRGVAIPELVREFLGLGAELNVMPYTTVILPPEIVEAPPLGSLCFHPSLLPRFRGGAAIPWQIILGEQETGVSVFRPDAGVDTGPIVLQRGGVRIAPTDSAGSLYFEKLYPLGVEAMVEAVAAVDAGRARPVAQDESQASFQGLLDDAAARIDWSRPARDLDRLIRGCDPQPGAHTLRAGAVLRLYDGSLEEGAARGEPGTVIALEQGRMQIAARGGSISIGRLRLGEGKKLAPGEAGLAVGERLG